jgi:hypothetical protein
MQLKARCARSGEQLTDDEIDQIQENAEMLIREAPRAVRPVSGTGQPGFRPLARPAARSQGVAV